jgi:hypothetical protein
MSQWKNWYRKITSIGMWNAHSITRGVREFVEKTYAGSGRPSIDPVVFFKLQLVMFFEGIVRCANRIL